MKKSARILDYICIIASICITGLALFSHHFGWSLYLERLSHFQVQYFLTTVTLSIVLLIRHRYRRVLIVLFCSAILSAQIVPWYVPSSLFSQVSGNYRIFISNVNRGQFDSVPTLNAIEQEQPDLVFLIEVHRDVAKDFEALREHLPYTAEKTVTLKFYLMLFSQYPLSEVEIVQFGNQDNKPSLVATVEVAGQPLSLVATHPSSPTSQRMLAARNSLFADVADYIATQTRPVVLMGDFNTTMWSPYYRQFVRRTNLKNTREGFGIWPTWPRLTSRFNLPTWTQGILTLFQIPLDHCLVSPDISVARVYTAADTGSDHAPLVVDLAVGNSHDEET